MSGKKTKKEDARDVLAREKDRELAVAHRNNGKRHALACLNGPAELHRGAFVHAFEPDSGIHEYGVVIHLTPKSIVLRNNESYWGSRLWLARCEIEVLQERQWEIVDAEQRRRREE
jgi:hypothetical protein